MNLTEIYLIALTIIFAVPWLVWRVLRTDYWAPLVVVQIVGGILLGPGVLGAVFPGLLRLRVPARCDHRAERRGVVGGDAVRVDRGDRA